MVFKHQIIVGLVLTPVPQLYNITALQRLVYFDFVQSLVDEDRIRLVFHLQVIRSKVDSKFIQHFKSLS